MSVTSITKFNGYDDNNYTYYPVLIVGAGLSGIAMGCRLKEKFGFDQFRMFERQGGIGGTWWINRYPGVACDIPAMFYSYSFAPNPKWTSFHPSGAEILKYLEGVCAKYKIMDKIQLNTEVTEARWLNEEEMWEVSLSYLRAGTGDLTYEDRQKLIQKLGFENVYLRTERVRAKILVSGTGGLVEPNPWPKDIPGREDFKGPIIHSSRWDYGIDFKDKNVVVVGTGCSAAQIVPKLTEPPCNAKSVTQLMRSPPWVIPRPDPPFGKENWEKWSPQVLGSVPGLARALRTLLFLLSEYDYRLFGNSKYNEKERRKVEEQLMQYMKQTVPEKYHDVLTPKYGVGCKRRVFDHTWFTGLNNPKLELTTSQLVSVQPSAVTLKSMKSDIAQKGDKADSADYKEIPTDVIVLANGFDVGDWVHPLKIIGRNGQSLHDVWRERGGAQAYLGTAMDGFPNFFIIFGPNTGTGHSSVILAIENMVSYALKFIGPILKGDVAIVEVKYEAEASYTRDIQEKTKKMITTTAGCRNWYIRDGWDSVMYPYSQITFTLKCMFPNWDAWNIRYTTKGLLRRRLISGLKLLLLVVSIVGLAQLRRMGYGLSHVPMLVQAGLRKLTKKS